MNKYKKLGKDFILLLIGNFSSKLLVFLMVPFYTSCLSTEQYGTADLITTTVTLLCPVLTLTINEAVMRFALDKDCNNKQVFSIGFYITIISIIVMVAILPLTFVSKSLKPYSLLLFIYYIANVFSLLMGQFTKGIDKVRIYTVSGIIQTVVNVALNVLFLLILKLGIEGYLWANIIGLLVGAVYAVIKLRIYKFIINPGYIDHNISKEMIKYSLPLIPNNLAWWVANSSDKYMISFFIGTASLGVYSVAYKIPSILTTITTLFAMSMRISSVDGFGSKESTKFINNTYRMYTAFLAIVTAVIVACSEIIGRILFQKEFFVAWKISPILLVGFMFFALAEYLGVIYLSSKHTKQILTTCLAGAGVNIILNVFFIPRWDNYGAALATSISYFVIWLLRIVGCQKYIRVHINSMLYIVNICLLIGEVILVLNKNVLGTVVILLAIFVINAKPVVDTLLIKVRQKKHKGEI